MNILAVKLLETRAKILIRCFFLNFAFVTLWFVLFLFGSGGWWYQIQSKIFDISKRDLAMITYYGIAFVKICNIMFFLFPYLAIKMILKMRK